MATKTQARRDDLRIKLLDLAEATIDTRGLSSLRARDLAKAAECSVGAIYNVFNDLDGLVMQVNGRTFLRLGKKVAASIDDMDASPPCERLVALAHTYLDFAQNNYRLWSALFGIKLTVESNVPEWYLQTLDDLFAHISQPVSELFPDLSMQDTHLMTRGLFSSVHGVVLLGLQQRISGLPDGEISRMLTLILSNLGRAENF